MTHKRGEIDDEILQKIKPLSSKPFCAYGLPKIHKCVDSFPPFHPIIDTTGTAYQPVVEYLSKLLNPLALNEFKLRDSFDAVLRIHKIPRLAQDFKFVSFDETSLLTNIPLRKTVNIILDRIYKNTESQFH